MSAFRLIRVSFSGLGVFACSITGKWHCKLYCVMISSVTSCVSHRVQFICVFKFFVFHVVFVLSL